MPATGSVRGMLLFKFSATDAAFYWNTAVMLDL